MAAVIGEGEKHRADEQRVNRFGVRTGPRDGTGDAEHSKVAVAGGGGEDATGEIRGERGEMHTVFGLR